MTLLLMGMSSTLIKEYKLPVFSFLFHRSIASSSAASAHTPAPIPAPTPANTPAQQSSVPPATRKRKRRESGIDEVDEALLSTLDKLHQHQDGEKAFGEHIASCLRQLNPHQRAIARVEIDKVLLNLQFPEDPYASSNYYNFN